MLKAHRVATRRGELRLVGALVCVAIVLLGYAGILYVRQQSAVNRYAEPAPLPSTASTDTSSAPSTAPAQLDLPTKGASKTTSPPAAVVTPIVPIQVFIPALGINTRVLAKGTIMAPDQHLPGAPVVNQFGVPSTGDKDPLTGKSVDPMRVVAWWSDGPKPGQQSDKLAVLLGHTQIGGYGVFNDLGKLRSGQIITLEARNHQALRYKVVGKKTGIRKDDEAALNAALLSAPKDASLALITCSGGVDRSIKSHVDNTVVFAALVTD